jgi:hypothetical protein
VIHSERLHQAKSSQGGTGANQKRVLIIGLDGATLDLIEPWPVAVTDG